jgi:hypothetical protein
MDGGNVEIAGANFYGTSYKTLSYPKNCSVHF